jgi:hypothetical protein
MNAEDDCSSWGATDVYTPFTAEPNEIPAKDGSIECLVSDTAGLFHAVDAL